jgi:hypothetical protein
VSGGFVEEFDGLDAPPAADQAFDSPSGPGCCPICFSDQDSHPTRVSSSHARRPGLYLPLGLLQSVAAPGEKADACALSSAKRRAAVPTPSLVTTSYSGIPYALFIRALYVWWR